MPQKRHFYLFYVKFVIECSFLDNQINHRVQQIIHRFIFIFIIISGLNTGLVNDN